MRSTTCSKMTAAIERILCSHDLLQDFLNNEEFAVRINNPPYLPLTIERHGKIVTLTHYLSENGDLIPDPDMEFQMISEHIWQPVAIQFATGHYRRVNMEIDGRALINPRELRDQITFSNMWAKNLIAQGFQNGNAVRIV